MTELPGAGSMLSKGWTARKNYPACRYLLRKFQVGLYASGVSDWLQLNQLADSLLNALVDNPFEVLDRRLNKLEALLVEILTHLRDGPPAGVPDIGGMELAQQLTRLSKARLYALVAARQIPHAKRGNRLYFTRTDLLAWLAAGQRHGHKA